MRNLTCASARKEIERDRQESLIDWAKEKGTISTLFQEDRRQGDMPLLTKMGSLRENGEEHQQSVLVQQQEEEVVREEKDLDSGYEDFLEEYGEDECVDSDMEGSIMQRGRPKKPVKAPAVPQRSEKRTSMLLQNVMLELQNLDGSRQKEADKASIVQESDPHELYLSSEEDASYSDDYEDSLTDLEATSLEDAEATRALLSRASSRKSQEDTARVVSFIMVGKPQIVDILLPNTSPSTTQNRHSLNLETLASFNTTPTTSPPRATRRPTPLKLYPAIRRMSISSITSSHFTYSPSSTTQPPNHPYAASSTTNISLTTTNAPLPPRKSSRLASNLSSLVTSTKNNFHSFLDSDPFATPSSTTSTSYIPYSNSNNNQNEEKEMETPITPKTPTSMAAAAWKKGFSKTMSKARKPSMPKLSLAYTAGVVTPRNNTNASSSKLNLALPPAEQEKDKQSSKPDEAEKKAIRMAANLSRHSSSSSKDEKEVLEKAPVRYEDIIKGAGEVIRSPTTIPTPKERRAMAFGRLVRTKSGKGRAASAQITT